MTIKPAYLNGGFLTASSAPVYTGDELKAILAVTSRENARPIPDIYWAGKILPDASSGPTTFASGHVATKVESSGAHFVVSKGRMTISPATSGGSACYFSTGDTGSKLLHVGGRFTFSSTDPNGTACISICNGLIAPTGSMPDMSCHFISTPYLWQFGVWAGAAHGNAGFAVLASGSYGFAAGMVPGTDYEMECILDDTAHTAQLLLPDGSTVSVAADSRITSYGGNWAFFETFTSSPTDSLAQWSAFWANSGYVSPRNPAAIPAVDAQISSATLGHLTYKGDNPPVAGDLLVAITGTGAGDGGLAMWSPPSSAIPSSTITSAMIVDGTITGTDIASGAITTAKIGTITKTGRYCNGGLGSELFAGLTSQTNRGWRFTVKLSVPSSRWRMRWRHSNTFSASSATSYTGVTLKGLKIGTPITTLTNTSGLSQTGNFSGSAATTLVSSDVTVPGDGTWSSWTSWFTDSGVQFDGQNELLLAMGITCSSTTIHLGSGGCFLFSSYTNALDPTNTSGTLTAGTPLDWQIEYDTVTSAIRPCKHILAIGDSITEGVQGGQGTSGSPAADKGQPPLWQSYVQQAAQRTGCMITNNSIAGQNIQNASTFVDWWNRMDYAPQGGYDAVWILMGTNDAIGGRTATQMITDMSTLVARIRSSISSTIPIYVGQPPPYNSTIESVRASFNLFMAQMPWRIAGSPDMNFVTKNVASGNSTAYDSLATCDNAHPSYVGTSRMVNQFMSGLPLVA